MKKYINISLYFILALFIAITWYNKKQVTKQLQETIALHQESAWYFSDSLSNLQLKITRYQDTLTQAYQSNISYENALQIGLVTEADLKKKLLVKVNEVTKLKEEISILNKPGEYLESDMGIIPESNSVELPLTMSFTDANYYLKVTARHPKPVLDSLSIKSYPIITIGMQKDPGLLYIFQKPKPVVVYDNLNPYIKVSDIQSYTIYKPQKWYQTDAAKIGGGIGIGIIIMRLLIVN